MPRNYYTEEEEREMYYDKEERVAHLERSQEGMIRYFEAKLPKAVIERCKGYNCPALLTNVIIRKTETGDLGKTCEVIKELIKHTVGEFGWYCDISKIFKELDTKKNAFWIECEFTPSSTREERKLEEATADTKKILLDLWKNISEEKIELLAKKNDTAQHRKKYRRVSVENHERNI